MEVGTVRASCVPEGESLGLSLLFFRWWNYIQKHTANLQKIVLIYHFWIKKYKYILLIKISL